MNAIREAIKRLLRGRAVSRLLASFGIDPKRYWLLMDLFGEISDRGEVGDQLGSNGMALKKFALAYFLMSAVLSLLMLVRRPPLPAYFLTFLVLTALFLLVVLLSEAGNSLVNPTEGLVLAHQPIDGATYTAAKLSHLGRIVLYFVPGLNVLPALAGLMWKEADWRYPLLHMTAALVVGVMAALLCCAAFGWLIRFLPVRRLRAAAQLASGVTLLFLYGVQNVLPGSSSATRGLLAFLRHWLPDRPAARWSLGIALATAAIAIVALGIRSLSADYLIRVSGLMRGGSAAGAKAGRSWIADLSARWFGGQGSRAGCAFVSRMMLRDFQFRRQVLGVAPMLVITGAALVQGLRTDPFTGKFTAVHLAPHLFGFMLFTVCSVLAYGSDYKGAWVFLLAPSGVLGRFARGVYAFLWIAGVIIPNLVLFLILAWFWGLPHAGLFAAYSLAAGSTYLALELRLIEGMPFSKPFDSTRGAGMLPLMFLGGFAIALAVGLQYLLFRSAAPVLIATTVLASAAYFLTRSSLTALEVSIRYNLGLVSVESGTLYKEVGT